MINKALHRQLTIEQDEPTSNLGMHLGDPNEVTIPAPPVTPVLVDDMWYGNSVGHR
jgi:hypothetical protein